MSLACLSARSLRTRKLSCYATFRAPGNADDVFATGAISRLVFRADGRPRRRCRHIALAASISGPLRHSPGVVPGDAMGRAPYMRARMGGRGRGKPARRTERHLYQTFFGL